MIRLRSLRQFILLAPLAALLSSCILVDDFGKMWDASSPDECLSKIGESLYYTEFRRDPANKDMGKLTHGWSSNGHHYLLLKKEEADKGGRLYRFQVVHGILQQLRLNPTMRETFEKDYPQAPVSLKRDTVTIKTLDAETQKLLDEVASKPEYWEIEEQTLYNPIMNPKCRFDDRDLTKKDQ